MNFIACKCFRFELSNFPGYFQAQKVEWKKIQNFENCKLSESIVNKFKVRFDLELRLYIFPALWVAGCRRFCRNEDQLPLLAISFTVTVNKKQLLFLFLGAFHQL